MLLCMERCFQFHQNNKMKQNQKDSGILICWARQIPTCIVKPVNSFHKPQLFWAYRLLKAYITALIFFFEIRNTSAKSLTSFCWQLQMWMAAHSRPSLLPIWLPSTPVLSYFSNLLHLFPSLDALHFSPWLSKPVSCPSLQSHQHLFSWHRLLHVHPHSHACLRLYKPNVLNPVWPRRTTVFK